MSEQNETTQEEKPDVLGLALELIEPVTEALQDIPAMLALNARCTLMAACMHKRPDGKTGFDKKAFDDAWAFATNEMQEEKKEGEEYNA